MNLKYLLTILVAKDLSKYNVIFCGGFAEYLYGIKKISEVKDIDIICTNDLIDILNLEIHNDGIYWGENIKRYKTIFKSKIIDVWVNDELPNYINIDGFKVQSIEDIIKSKEISLKHDIFSNPQQKEKIQRNLKRLKNFYIDNQHVIKNYKFFY